MAKAGLEPARATLNAASGVTEVYLQGLNDKAVQKCKQGDYAAALGYYDMV